MGLSQYAGLGQSVGKDFPASGPFKSYQPKVIGPGSGKLKVAIRIANYLLSRKGIAGTLSGAVIGTGLALDGQKNISSQSYRLSQAYNKPRHRNNINRQRKKHNCCRCC